MWYVNSLHKAVKRVGTQSLLLTGHQDPSLQLRVTRLFGCRSHGRRARDIYGCLSSRGPAGNATHMYPFSALLQARGAVSAFPSLEYFPSSQVCYEEASSLGNPQSGVGEAPRLSIPSWPLSPGHLRVRIQCPVLALVVASVRAVWTSKALTPASPQVLTDWVSDVLVEERIIVKQLEEDLYDGQVLQKLLGESTGRAAPQPHRRPQLGAASGQASRPQS